MFNLFKRNKIEFYSIIPGIEKVSPIQHASSFKPKWLKSAAQDYKQKIEENSHRKITSVLKCPGIMSTFNMGYILYNYCDISITATETSLNWHYLWEQSKAYPEITNNPYIEAQSPDLLTKYMPPPYGANENLLKFNTPWRVKAPDDIVFLEMPLLYADDRRFATAGGILDPKQTNQIHPAFWWFVNDGTPQIIKAGTPLVQYIPIKRNLCTELLVRECTQEELKKDKIFLMLTNMNFQTDVNYRQENTDKILQS
jgi:hypothetical protein